VPNRRHLSGGSSSGCPVGVPHRNVFADPCMTKSCGAGHKCATAITVVDVTQCASRGEVRGKGWCHASYVVDNFI